ncbi:MAG: tRNA uridine-5-carboxymethylaminomethyl(34) synthesis GTPase MnmE [Acidobacteria bacterium]|nr:tRNA uridine-5-carboxymethylaminomethyl(34) synthesis GTPase MnmE [Acidobacteriota bacterium]
MVFSSASSSGLAGAGETIVAPATAPGRGALAILRVSGDETARAAARACPGLDFSRAWRAQLVDLVGGPGEVIERGIVIPYHGPQSYTGEDMLEVIVHGSAAVTAAVMDAFIAGGCRVAEPGEFTRRAVANGKMDLIQAEGVADIVAAETAWQVRAARAQMEGALSGRIEALRHALTGLLARLEGEIDFAAQGVANPPGELAARRDAIRNQIEALLATAASGERIRDGIRVAIVGVPNAGKSTLFNALLKAERAIVSPHPGTTRDVIEAEAEIGGMAVTLVDTAGLRPGETPVEAEGVRRARMAAAEADLLLAVHPCNHPEDPDLNALIDGRSWIGILSKTDLAAAPASLEAAGWIPVSLKTGEGFERVEAALRKLVAGGLENVEGAAVINRRHRANLEAALDEVTSAPLDEPELGAEALRAALGLLDELIGTVETEDVLDRVFASFCLGK